MNAFLAIVVLALMSVATADMSSCGTPNMTSTFNTTGVAVSPTVPARNINWTFTLTGYVSTPISNVMVTVTTSLCIPVVGCVAVDSRMIPCSNAAGCAFPVGTVNILTQQLIPSFTPAGTYSVEMDYVGTTAAGSVGFGCAVDKFNL